MRRVAILLSFLLYVAAEPIALPAEPRHQTYGTRADGRVVGNLPDGHSPWASDILNRTPPDFSGALRKAPNGGEALCRVVLNVRTGSVRDVIVERSSGNRSLDASIAHALRQLRLKPGKWKDFQIHIGVWPRKEPNRF